MTTEPPTTASNVTPLNLRPPRTPDTMSRTELINRVRYLEDVLDHFTDRVWGARCTCPTHDAVIPCASREDAEHFLAVLTEQGSCGPYEVVRALHGPWLPNSKFEEPTDD